MDSSTRGSRPSTLEYKRSMSINYGHSQNMDVSHSQAVVAQPSSADEIAGMLLKRRGGFGKHMPNSWQLRYFTIRDGVIMYFEGDNSSHPRGRVDLRALNCTFQLGLVFENAPTPFTLQIAPGGGEEKWKLCAESPEDLERWSMCIEKHVNDKNRREANIHIGSDDETFPEEGDGEPRRRALSIPKVAAPRGLTPVPTPLPSDAANANAAAQASIPSQSPAIGQSPSAVSSGKPKSSGKRRGLKLKSESTTPPETVEMIMTVAILNLCVIMLKYSDQLLLSLAYILIANIVVARTLFLRQSRVALLSVAAVAASDEPVTSPLTGDAPELKAVIGNI